MHTWIESVVHAAKAMPVAFGVLGALIPYAVASRLGLHNGVRLVLAAAGFATLFMVGGASTTRATVRALIDSERDSASDAERIAPPLWKYAGVATDTTGAALASFLEDALRELRGDSVVCVNFLYGVLHSRVPSQLSPGLHTRFQELIARVADEAQLSPQPRVDSLSAVTLGRMMVTRLEDAHGQRRAREIVTVMSDPANGLAKPRAVCDAASAMYTAIADMPPSTGGKLMRPVLDRQAVAPARAPHLRSIEHARRATGSG
jgi:hypothetical protein